MADDTPIKTDDAAARKSSGYKSWKKKYRKMRIAFERSMTAGEDILHQQSKAAATVKRLAVENDRLLDLLLDINNSPQIPPEKRIYVELPEVIGYRGYSGEDEYTGDVNKDLEGTKKLKDLLADVPHMSHEAAIASSTLPSLTEELSKPFDDEYPAHFLSPDDVDNYIHVIDARLDPDSHVPTMAPIAHPGHPPPLHPLLRNPNSSTSWLRRHAPHIFLQGHDNSSATVAGAEALERASAHANDDDEGASTVGASAPSGNSSSRKSRPSGAAGRDKASAKEKNSTPATAKASKRASTAAAADDDTDTNATPAPKGKRKRDEDAGYRPKGGSSSRPSKKKRKSETGASGTEGTPTVKRAKKEAAAANGDD